MLTYSLSLPPLFLFLSLACTSGAASGMLEIAGSIPPKDVMMSEILNGCMHISLRSSKGETWSWHVVNKGWPR